VGHEYAQDESAMIEAYCYRARAPLDNTGQEAWLEWANPLDLMSRTWEAITERNLQLQCEVEAQQEQQQCEAEQR
jgi:hypothetical protein